MAMIHEGHGLHASNLFPDSKMPVPSEMSKKERVLQQIRRDILSRKRKPGETLTAKGLEKDFPGISRSPIREALESLVHSGLITWVGPSGAVIRTVDDDMLYDIQKCRYAIQVEGSLTLAARRNPRHLAELESIHQQMKLLAPEVDREKEARAADQTTADEFYELDIKFHRTGLRLTGMHELETDLANKMGMLRLYAGGRIVAGAVLPEHEAIINAIKGSGGELDEERAKEVRNAERTHIIGTAARYSREVVDRLVRDWKYELRREDWPKSAD